MNFSLIDKVGRFCDLHLQNLPGSAWDQACQYLKTALDLQEPDGGVGGYVTDEELELCQTLQPTSQYLCSLNLFLPYSFNKHLTFSATTATSDSKPESNPAELEIIDTDKLETAKTESSPSKEVLIGGDNNPSRR